MFNWVGFGHPLDGLGHNPENTTPNTTITNVEILKDHNLAV